MKRYIYLIVAAGLLLACSKDNDVAVDKEPVGIEIRFFRAGEAINDDISLGAGKAEIVVDVELNNENLYWNIESDAPSWCSVVEEEHRGNGSFTLDISAHEGHDSREPAVITFRSGQYSRKAFQVSQSGEIFIVDETYLVRSKDSGSAEIEVSVKEGYEWECSGESWMQVTKGSGKVNVSWNENRSQGSRLGTIKLFRAGESVEESRISFCQLGTETGAGTEYGYADGAIILPAMEETEPVFEILAPASYIESVDVPEWIRYSTADAETADVIRYSFFNEDNPSDTRSVRGYEIGLSVMEQTGKVKLPIRQDYYPVSGIITANGLKMFAETVNAGGDFSDWTADDGSVVVLNDIDMTALEGNLASIGSEQKPFEGKFDGGSFEIKKMESSSPLFGFCKGATISNVTIDETSVFTVDAGNAGQAFGTLVGSMEDGTVYNCHSNATVNISGTSSTVLQLGGLVGQMNVGVAAESKSEIDGCSFGGAIVFADSFVNTEQTVVAGIASKTAAGASIKDTRFTGSINYKDATGEKDAWIAGISADLQGSLTGCETAAEAAITTARDAKTTNVLVGGIAAKVSDTGSVKDCHNKGNLNLTDGNGGRGTAYKIGGVVAESDGEVTDSGNEGSLTMNLYRDTGHIGGVIGSNSETGIIKTCENSGNIEISGVLTGNTSGIGGVCGYNASADVDNLTNTGNLKKVGNFYANASINYHIGGVIGRNTVKIDGTPTMTNSGSIDLSDCGTSIFNIGGIIGYADDASTYTNCIYTGSIIQGSSGTWNVGSYVGGPTVVDSLAE